MGVTYRIYPPIGIARVGNSPEEYFIGPESPGHSFAPQPSGQYRDSSQRIRRQGARFRIYECSFDEATPEIVTPVREITVAEAEIKWTVQLANTKAAQRELNAATDPRTLLEINPGPITVTGANQNSEVADEITIVDQWGQNQSANVTIGDLKTDDAGRLIVLGGHGAAQSLTGEPANSLFNNGWFDDAADGPINATIQIHGATVAIEVESAWAIVGPPAYAHPVFNIVTMFDLALDIATRLPAPNNLKLDPECSFTRDIYPVLQRAVAMRWVSPVAWNPHGSGDGNFLETSLFKQLHDPNEPGSNSKREYVFSRLKDPVNGGDGVFPHNMPDIRNLSLTQTQYDRFQVWSEGNFKNDWIGTPPEPSFDTIPISEQPAALTRAALEAGVGGSFHPGIEVSSLFNSTLAFKSPFRISDQLNPGDLTQNLSIPWQTDFKACGTGWWPGGRPNMVMNSAGSRYDWVPGHISMANMVDEWSNLGFLAKEQNGTEERIIETERLL